MNSENNQKGNKRIEAKLESIGKKIGLNTKNLSDHLVKYNKEQEELTTNCQSMKLEVDCHNQDIADMKDTIALAQRESIRIEEDGQGSKL